MNERNTDLQKLFSEKKYLEIIKLIENQNNQETLSAGLLNLLGACKILKSDKSDEDLISANLNFKKSYLKEKKTVHGLNGLINFINTSADIFDKKNHQNLPENYFEEIEVFFKEAEIYFLFNVKLILSIIRIYKRQNKINEIIFYLEKLIKNNCTDPKILCSYIYRNCFIKNWTQNEFLSYGKLLNKNLNEYSKNELSKITKTNNGKIRIGFLTSDIKKNHSITHFLKTVLIDYNKNRYEIVLILNTKNQDITTESFKSLVDKNIDISNLKDVEAINIIRDYNIDIAIDLMGVTSTNRMVLFKNRLALKQLSWLGYCNTTGLDQMDYMIADPNVIKKDETTLYSEKVIFLPEIWNCHSGLDVKRTNYQSPCFKNNFFTFGSFNNFNKINDDVIRVWSEILKNVNKSRLVLKSSIPMQKNKIKDLFKKYGVLDSVIFHETKTFSEHLNLYKTIDLALDTFPYNGVTTSFEAIWMGVPVLTMKGYNFNSRCGESINKNLNINYLISENEQEYISKSMELSHDYNKLTLLRNKIYKEAPESPLFNTKKFAKEFFKSLENIYKN